MDPKTSRSESERQAEHFRNIQWTSLVAVNVYFGAGLIVLLLVAINLPPDKYDKVRDLLSMIMGGLLMEWKNVNQYSFGSTAGSARNAETIRKIVDNTKPVSDSPIEPKE